MSRYTCRHFRLEELVPKKIFSLYGESLWDYFDPNLLKAQDMLRDEFGQCTINDWLWGGKYQYRGFRPYTYDKGAPLSQHRLFKALDSQFKGVSAERVREFLVETNGLGRLITRIEGGVSWVHIDTKYTGKDTLTVFKP